MGNTEKVTPNFAKSYLLLLQQSQTMHDNFVEDLAAFTARYPFMDAAYATDFQNAIDAADNAPDDAAVVGEQKQKTILLSESVAAAEEKLTVLESFLRLTYKNDPQRVLDHFGYKRSRRGRLRQMQLKEKVALAYERANSATYKADLIAKGFLQADIDQLNDLAQQIDADNQVQEKAKTDRLEMTQERISLYNAVWDIMNEIHIAAEVVFANDFAKRQHYVLYPENSPEQVIGIVQNIIDPSAYNVELALPEGAEKLRITVLSGGPLEFGLCSGSPVFSGNTTVMNEPGVQTLPVTFFVSEGNTLLAHNQNAADEGEYKIEILA